MNSLTRKIVALAAFVCLSNIQVAQVSPFLKHTWNWHFGYNCSLDFSSGSPVAGNSSIHTFEGCAAISNPATGTLLFYTDGQTVWDRTGTAMANGTGLFGNFSSTQSAVVVPFPGSTTKFYIFTTDQGGYLGANKGMYYSVVDMTLNSGFGDITTKNTLLLGPPVTEKVIAVRACNGTDSWVITHQFLSNNFYSFPVTASGIGTAVISSVGSVYTNGSGGSYETVGCMAISPDGSKLASTIYDNIDALELFDFDKSTGMVSNPISLNKTSLGVTGFQPYGVMFSPDNKKLYVTHTNEASSLASCIFQLDISTWTQAAVVASKYVVNSLAGNNYYSMVLGPDNKGYITKYNNSNLKFLDVIANPNGLGAGCGFALNSINIPFGTSVVRGLPVFLTENIPLTIGNDTTVNCNSSFSISLDAGSALSYTWSTGAGTQNILVTTPGMYWVSKSQAGCLISDTIHVAGTTGTLGISIASNSVICTGQSATLTANGSGSLTWTPGNISGNMVVVSPASTQAYTVTSQSGTCTALGVQTIVVAPSPSLTINTPSICAGQTATITASGATTYSWSTGSNQPAISVSPAVTTSYILTASNGTCLAMATASVVVNCTGVDELTANAKIISIYPNPASESFTIVNSQAGLFEVCIYNSTGQMVYATIASEKSLPINVAPLSKGIYNIVVKTAGGNTTGRIILE